MYIVAEIGSNWTPGSIQSIYDMIGMAAGCGADAVKMQDFNPIGSMLRPDSWKARCRPWELPYDWAKLAQLEATRCGLDFFTSVFTFDAITRSRSNVGAGPYPIVKVASSEITNQALLLALSEIPQTQIHLSLGLVEWRAQVHTAIARLGGHHLTLLACVAEYPVKRPLDLLDGFQLARTFGLPAGISSHVAYPEVLRVATGAVSMGASVVEVHVRTKDTPPDCPDNGPWALYPEQLKELVEAAQ